MSLYEQWKDLIGNQTDATFKEFWAEYSTAETDIYTDLLANFEKPYAGTLSELAKKNKTNDIIFTGFLDGISTSLIEEIDLDSLTPDSEISLIVDFEKLYFNMHIANADYLYEIPQWEDILSEEKRIEIKKYYKKSKTITKEQTPGRNDPCPCGSGKKYKKCCGK